MGKKQIKLGVLLGVIFFISLFLWSMELQGVILWKNIMGVMVLMIRVWVIEMLVGIMYVIYKKRRKAL